MHDLDDMMDEARIRNDTKNLSESALRASFLRSCSSHYISVVLPELRRFEQHLKKQDVLVAISPIQPFNKNVLQAGLIIEYPIDNSNLLDIRYDYVRQDLAFSQVFSGHRNQEPDYQFPMKSIAEVTSLHLYDIVERFAASVLALQVERRRK